MVSTVIDILNARLQLTGFFHTLYCLVEKKKEERDGGDFVFPAQYVGGGDLQMIEFDSAGFAYFRKDGEITQSIVDNDFGQSQWYEVTIPLKLVAMVNRSDVGGDNAFSPDVLARQIASSLTFKNGDLRTALTAAKTQVNAANWITDPEQIWSDETEGTGAIEPDYSRAFIAMSVTVSVTADERCIQNLCEADTDILHIFDFCKAATVARLSPEQVACLSGDYTLVNTAIPPQTLDSGTIPLGGGVTLVAPPVTVLVNGQPFAVVPSGETEDVPVVNGGSNPVGSEQGGEWVIGNSEVFINAVQVADIVAEDPANLAVELDGVPSGTWNAGTQTWEVDSLPCPDGSVEINGDFVANVASGGMVNIMVEQDGNPVGAFDPNSNSWVIPPCGAGGSVAVTVSNATPDLGDSITITATPTGFTPNNYLFFAYDGASILKIAEQVSGVYNWFVQAIGAFDIYAVATDGTVRSWGKVGVVANAVLQAETTAFMNAVGIAPDFTVYYSSTIYQRTGIQLWVAVNNLVIALKAIGWAKFKGVWVYVGGTDSRHKWNIINPLDTNAAFRQVFFGGWTHGPTGAQPNGVNAYANTFLAPNGNQSLTSGHFSIYSRTVAASTDAFGSSGVRDSAAVTSTLVIRRPTVNVNQIFMWGENTNDFTPAVTSTDGRGFYLGSRTSSSSLILQKNGTTISSVGGAQTASALSINSYFLSALNLAGSPLATTYDNKEIAFASIGEGLTASEGLALYNAVQVYQSALNRAV